MRTRPTPDRELARVAGMIGDPTRAAMLGALLGGEAAALEALGRIAPSRRDASAAEQAPNGSIRFARTCYDHLAGVLGVMVTERLLERRFIVGSDSYEVTTAGGDWLESLGIDLDGLRRSRRAVARPCLDWTERRDHLAGGAGAAIATVMLERRWITRVEGSRAVRLTLGGREALRRTLGLNWGQSGSVERNGARNAGVRGWSCRRLLCAR
jgi:hypothetical protein